MNAVCYAIAIPFTLLFKLITNRAPFPGVNTTHDSKAIRALSTEGELLIARGIV